jgi:hypothetical protein
MRPRIGKTPHWDKVSPNEAKEIRKEADKRRKFAIVRGLRWEVTYEGGHELKEFAYVLEEGSRFNLGDPEILLKNLTKQEAEMWVKMME